MGEASVSNKTSSSSFHPSFAPLASRYLHASLCRVLALLSFALTVRTRSSSKTTHSLRVLSAKLKQRTAAGRRSLLRPVKDCPPVLASMAAVVAETCPLPLSWLARSSAASVAPPRLLLLPLTVDDPLRPRLGGAKARVRVCCTGWAS